MASRDGVYKSHFVCSVHVKWSNRIESCFV